MSGEDKRAVTGYIIFKAISGSLLGKIIWFNIVIKPNLLYKHTNLKIAMKAFYLFFYTIFTS